MTGRRVHVQRLAGAADFARVVLLGRLYGISYVVRYLRNPHPGVTARLLRAFGARVGQRTTFKGALIVENSVEDQDSVGDLSNLTIGHNCYIGEGVHFDLANWITIGDDSVVSGGVSFLTHEDCNRSRYLARRFPRKSAPVQVGQGAWLGFRATVMPGVTIGAESVLAAGGILRSDVPPRTLYAGIPARPIRSLDNGPGDATAPNAAVVARGSE